MKGICLFCGKRANSDEHVIPQWLFRAYSGDDTGAFPVTVAKFLADVGIESPWTFTSLNFKRNIVCADCNGGWMSTLESQVGQILKFLLNREFPSLHQIAFDHLRGDSTTIALWAAKTALLVGFCLPGEYALVSQIPPSDIRKEKVPDGIWVELAVARDRGIGAAVTRQFLVRNGNREPDIANSQGSFQFCLQVNHLLVRVARAPQARTRYYRGKEPEVLVGIPKGEIPFRIYPNPSRIPDDVAYRDLQSFFRAVSLVTFLGCQSEV